MAWMARRDRYDCTVPRKYDPWFLVGNTTFMTGAMPLTHVVRSMGIQRGLSWRTTVIVINTTHRCGLYTLSIPHPRHATLSTPIIARPPTCVLWFDDTLSSHHQRRLASTGWQGRYVTVLPWGHWNALMDPFLSQTRTSLPRDGPKQTQGDARSKKNGMRPWQNCRKQWRIWRGL